MIAVVTGSSGFIGTHLVSALRLAGAEVRTLRRPASRPQSHSDNGANGAKQSDSALGQLRSWTVNLLDAAAVSSCGVWDGATHVFHLAGATRGVRESDFERANVQPTSHIAAALARRALPPRLIVVSSQAAAGPTPRDADARTDAMSPDPIEGYGRSKLAGENAAWRWREAVPMVVLRPSAVFGPGDGDFLAAFKQVEHRIAWLASSPEQQLSMLFVHDFVRCLLEAAVHPGAVGQRWLVAHPQAISWRDLYLEMARLATRTPRLIEVPRTLLRAGAAMGDLWGRVTGNAPLLTTQKFALAEARGWVCDPSGISRTIGWRAATTLRDGLEQTRGAYVDEGCLPDRSFGSLQQ